MYDAALERDTRENERDVHREIAKETERGERASERAVIDICFMCTHIGIETVNIF